MEKAGDKKPKDKAKKSAGKKAKKHLHQVVTTQAHDGTFSHEHVYKNSKEDMHHHPPVFAGTSSSMEDLHQHMDDHFGPQAGGGGEEEEPDGDEAAAGAEPAPTEPMGENPEQ